MAMTMGDGQAWVLIISTVFAGVISVLTLIFQQKNNANTVVQRERVEKEVGIIKKQTNHTLGEAKYSKMISAQLLANNTKLPDDVKLAAAAKADYLNHQRQMADAGSPAGAPVQ